MTERPWDRAGPAGTALPPPVLLRLGPRVVVLNAGTRVTGHHLRRDYDYGDTVAEVVVHPARPELWGLRNHTGSAVAGHRPRRHRAGGGPGPQPRPGARCLARPGGRPREDRGLTGSSDAPHPLRGGRDERAVARADLHPAPGEPEH